MKVGKRASSQISGVARSKLQRVEEVVDVGSRGLGLGWEKEKFGAGLRRICGCDEAGRGPLAGPVVGAALCLLSPDESVMGIDDSKEMTEEQREVAFEGLVTNQNVAWAIAVAPPTEIERVNILQASLACMTLSAAAIPSSELADAERGELVDASSFSLDELVEESAGVMLVGYRGTWKKVPMSSTLPPWSTGHADVPKFDMQSVAIDGNRMPPALRKATDTHGIEAEVFVGGDGRIFSIAAASVLAKVWRDRIMVALDSKIPEYGLARHKGYPTPDHRAIVVEHGPSRYHRFNFAPIKGNWIRDEKGEPIGAVVEKEAQVSEDGEDEDNEEVEVIKTRSTRAERAARRSKEKYGE